MTFKNIIASILFLTYCFCGYSQYQKSTWQPYGLNFDHLTIEDGLSQSTINQTYQDSYGFLWFLTQDGLNKFDGYTFTIYTPVFNDTTSISDNQVWAITEDEYKNLWIGTYSGLNKFNREKEVFQRFTTDENNPNSISNNQIIALFSDNKNLWIGTVNGLDVINIETGKISHYKNIESDTNSISSNYIRGFCKDNFDRIWILTDNNGINLYNKTNDNFSRYTPLNQINANDTRAILSDSENQLWIGTNTNGLYKINFSSENKSTLQKVENYPLKNVTSLIEDENSIIWIGSTEGLVRYDKLKNEFVQYRVDINNSKSLNDNHILNILEDKNGIIWIGTNTGGINKFDKTKNKFSHYQIIPNEGDLIVSNFIRAFTTDNQGNVWVGSKGGLYKFCLNETLNIYEQTSYKTANKLKDNYIRELVTDSLGNIWIATNSEGLAYLDFSKKIPEFSSYKYDSTENSICSNKLRTVYIDKSGNLWVGSTDNGFDKVYRENGKIKFEHFQKKDYENLTDNYIRAICQDFDGFYWIGTENGGLIKFDYQNKEFTSFTHSSSDNSISSNTVTNIHEDEQHNLWIGTYGGGLNLFNKNNLKFTVFNKSTGFPNNVIYGILEDKNQNLWISTNFGLIKFNIQNYDFTLYGIWDGLQSNEFNTGAFYKTPKGEMIFGGINGFNIFYPEIILKNNYLPDIVLTDFKIFGISVSPKDKNQVIDKSITYVDEIKLDYNQNVITIEFSALHYSNPFNNQFKYKLEGIDNAWTIVKNSNSVTYTHLPPGQYTFIVTSSNCDGVWSEIFRELKIIIKPPVYDTLVFKIFIVLAILLMLVLIFLLRTSRLKKQKMELEKQVLIRTKEVEDQNDEILTINDELELQNQKVVAQSKLLTMHNLELQKLSLVASKTNNSVMIMNENAEIEWVNEGFAKMYGLTYEELILKFGTNMRNLSVKENINELIEKCSKQNQVINYESFVNRPDINKIWVQTTLSPVIDNDNKVVKIIAIEADITELKNAEEEIIIKNNEIRAQKEALIQQNEEIYQHKEQLVEINEKLANQNDKITGSIRTAKAIQNAILPDIHEIKKYFDCFILFQPKDIVSGDFYWFVRLSKKINLTEKYFFAVSDCTGHGVPGAFMSMIGSRMLSEIVNERLIFEPSMILETLNKEIIKALKQDNQENYDGMDICFCYIEKINDNHFHLTFSGARRNLYIYSSSSGTVEVFKGDRKSIGGTFSKTKTNFTNHKITLDKNNIIYLSTDGFADQIGTTRMKFTSTRLLNFLLKNCNLEMEQQKDFLVNEIKNWQGAEMQRDDMTILGLKII